MLYLIKKININSYLKSEAKNKFTNNFENADLANLSGYPYLHIFS